MTLMKRPGYQRIADIDGLSRSHQSKTLSLAIYRLGRNPGASGAAIGLIIERSGA